MNTPVAKLIESSLRQTAQDFAFSGLAAWVFLRTPLFKNDNLGLPLGWGTLVEQVSNCLTLKGQISCSSGSSGKTSYCLDSGS